MSYDVAGMEDVPCSGKLQSCIIRLSYLFIISQNHWFARIVDE
jgi:hypothetical protein